MKSPFLKTMLLLLLPLLSLVSEAQNVKKMLANANELFDAHAYRQAIPHYRDVLLFDNSFEAKMKLAHCYRLINNYEKAEYWYNQLVSTVPNEPLFKLYYAQILQSNGKYEEAKHWFLDYGKYDVLGERLAEGIDRRVEWSTHDNEYEILLLPINSPQSDFSPAAYRNGIIFCSDRQENLFNKSEERTFVDIYYTEKMLGNAYSTPVKLKGKVNGPFNDGPAVAMSGDSVLFFSRNSIFKGKKRRSNEGSIKLSIFTAEPDKHGKWSNISDFQHNYREYAMTHPAISADGQNLYFVSDMPGGYGGTDIYVCTRIDSLWSQPVNLGATVNTSENERFPYIDDVGQLYFSSNGHPGLGGLDLFKTKFQNGRWIEAVNLGAPFNSPLDDFSIVFVTDYNGYFSSNRQGGYGKDDIYSFQLRSAKAALENKPPGEVLAVKQPTISNTIINESIGLNKLDFATGTWELSPQILLEVDKVAAFLLENKEVMMEIRAHTDTRGDDFVNFEISSRRSEAIHNYLLQRGVSANRIKARGYGELKLLNHCRNGMQCSDAQHDENNRIEFKVVSISGIDNRVSSFASNTKIFTPKESKQAKKTSKKSDQILQPTGQHSKTLEYKQLNYRVWVGPFKEVDNDTYYTYAELNTQMDLEYNLKKGMMIVLGPYPTIKEAETYQFYAQQRGAKKTKVVVYNGDEHTNLDVKELKKMGNE